MISRRGFIKGALALVATSNISTVVERIIVDPYYENSVTVAQLNSILKRIYMPQIIENIFTQPILLNRLDT